MTIKRKRTSSTPSQSNTERRESNTSQSNESTRSVPVAEQNFSIIVHPYSSVERARKAPVRGNRTAILKQNPVTSHGPKCGYQVSPADGWNEMRKFNKFVVQDKNFTIGDYIWINYGDVQQGALINAVPTDFWVAQVLEIRATDSSHVYVRVFWLYWPEDLPGGRQYYHGKHELIHSTDMQILDAMTVTEGSDVQYWNEKDVMPVDDLYWRQILDFNKGTLSNLRQHCYCNAYHDTNTMLIQCPSCKTYLHEKCLLRDAQHRAWKERNKSGAAVNEEIQLESSGTPKIIKSTIPDSQMSDGALSQPSWTQLSPPPKPPVYTKVTTKTKRRKIGNSKSEQWEDRTTAELQFKESQGETIMEASGWATVTIDPIDESSQTVTVGLRCLMPRCGRWLHDESSSKSQDTANHQHRTVDSAQPDTALAPQENDEQGHRESTKFLSEETLIEGAQQPDHQSRPGQPEEHEEYANKQPEEALVKQEKLTPQKVILESDHEDEALSNGIEFLSQEIQQSKPSSFMNGLRNTVFHAFKTETSPVVPIDITRSQP